ncbi:MAG: hypothetical protein GY950_24970, partial [bacterium]|nr:hypothetical protein [bacterium]
MIIAFVFQMNLFLYSQGKDELLKQFDRAREAYNTGLYANTRNRVERIIAILNEKDMDRKQIMGACFLMLGAIYEKEEKNRLAEENYRKAIKVYGVDTVTGVDFSLLPVYKRVKEIVGIENRFESAKSDYSKGTEEKYTAAAEKLKALEKVLNVNIPEEKIFLGKVFLLLAGVYERLHWREIAVPTVKKRARRLKKSAKVYYRKARKILAP